MLATGIEVESVKHVAPKPSPPKLPKWLRRLSTESWQVELLISGFAIVGTSQLISTVEPMAEWILLNVRFEYVNYLRWALYYLAIGFVALPAIFVTHFAFRTYWVGLVGLSSVYPRGFGTNYGTVPEWVVRDMEERSPSLHEQIDKVERRSSIMFAIAALSAMMFASIAIGIAVLFGLGFAVDKLTDGAFSLPQVFFLVIGLLTISYFAVVGMLVLKRFHHIPRFRKTYLILAKAYQYLFYTIFAQPASYLVTMLTTNIKSWRAAIGPGIIGFFVLELMIIYIMSQPASSSLIDTDDIAIYATRTDLHRPQRYRAEWSDDLILIDPSIETQLVDPTAGPMLLSLPMLGEDEFRRDELFPLPDSIGDLPSLNRKHARWAANLDSGHRYWRLQVDGRITTLESLVSGSPTGQRASGYMAYVDVAELTPGPHLLQLEVARDTGWAPHAVIPFRIVQSSTLN